MLRFGYFALLTLSIASIGKAQTPPTTTTTPTPVAAQGATAAPAATTAAPAATTAAPAATTPAAPPAFLVVVLGERNATSTWEAPLREALSTNLAQLVRGRAVNVLTDTQAFASCRAADCLGQAIASAQGVGALLVRLHARDARTLDVQLELVDPVSGAARHEPVRGQIPASARSAPSSALAPMLAELTAALPAAPPPPASLLVTVTADDAVVMVDGHEVGRSPLAPFSIPTGTYTVVVSRSGYETLTRRVQVGESGTTRADFDLVPTAETASAIDSSPTGSLGAVDHSIMASQASNSSTSDDETPFYARWYVIAGASAVVVAAVVIIVATSSGGGDTLPPNGIPIPPIVR